MGEKNKKQIKIPTYELIEPSISKKDYLGWSFMSKIVANAFISIEFRNEQLVQGEGIPVWCFSICTHNGFPISFVRLRADNNPEESYKIGIQWLMDETKRIGKEMLNFQNQLKLVF